MRVGAARRLSVSGTGMADELSRGGWLWFHPNKLDRLTLGTRDTFEENADGSATLYFENQSPGADKEANWPRPRPRPSP